MKYAIRIVALATVLLSIVESNANTPPALPSYNVKLNETSVSGISSGAYMAVQFAVAYSSIIKGVGAIAGGPYYCSQNSITTATQTCMIGNPDAAALVSIAKQLEKTSAVDPLKNVAKQKIWLFNGITMVS